MACEDSKNTLVVVCILNWNNSSDTIRCVRLLLKSKDANWRLVLLDNGSCRGEFNALLAGLREIGLRIKSDSGGPSAFPPVIHDTDHLLVMRCEENMGFTGGHNLTVGAAQKKWSPDYLLLLNNDTEPDAFALSHLVAVAHTTKAGIVGVATRSKGSERCHFTGSSSFRGLYIRIPPKDLDEMPEVWETLHADGAAMLINASLVHLVIANYGSLFDTKLFLYGEDAELCYRARKLGYLVVMTKVPLIYHQIAVSSGGRGSAIQRYYVTRNRVWLANRWLSTSYKLLFHVYYPLSRLGRAMVLGAQGRWKLSKAVLDGLWDAYTFQYGRWKRHI